MLPVLSGTARLGGSSDGSSFRGNITRPPAGPTRRAATLSLATQALDGTQSSLKLWRTAYLVARGGVEPPTFRFSVGRSYQLSYLAVKGGTLATPTGLEPATSAVTGRRANQLRYRALLVERVVLSCVPPTGFEPVLPP